MRPEVESILNAASRCASISLFILLYSLVLAANHSAVAFFSRAGCTNAARWANHCLKALAFPLLIILKLLKVLDAVDHSFADRMLDGLKLHDVRQQPPSGVSFAALHLSLVVGNTESVRGQPPNLLLQ